MASSTIRRSANYKPTIWDDAYIQSLNNPYGEKGFLERAEQLKGEVKMLLEKTGDLYDQIELIDVLQRLGIHYHFTDFIDKVLKNASSLSVVDDDDDDDDDDEWDAHNLHAVALKFRLLRNHGYIVSQDVFRDFMDDERRGFKRSLSNDIKGLMSLYEASYLLMEGEATLELAQSFAAQHLQEKLNQNIDQNTVKEITHSLELPYHWRMQRVETRWFIDAYEKRQDMKPLLLEFAKLDFNMVQAMYQDELKELWRWYTKTELAKKMNFARDRLVESFFWSIGFTYEPRFRYCRIMSVKIAVLVTILDDIYDVYGTLDELTLLTSIIDRWDINDLNKLPEYMRTFYLALFNTVNEMAYDIFNEQGFNIIPYASKIWAKQCKTYLAEAQWYFSGYKPSLEEYLDNGWVSITGPVIMGHGYFCLTNKLEDKQLEDMEKCPEIIKWTSLVCRLADDLGNASDELKRGDTPKSIQCCMHDAGCNEEDARAYIKNLIASMWKKINRDVLMNREYGKDFINASINFARVSQCVYEYGDGTGIPDGENMHRVVSVIMEPIPLE